MNLDIAIEDPWPAAPDWEALAGRVAGRVAVFGSPDPGSGAERLVVVAELHPRHRVPASDLRAEINRICSEVAGSPPESSRIVSPCMSTAPQPPGPGLPLHAPSV